MIYARYKLTRNNQLKIELLNAAKVKRGYTNVSSTFHLENAIAKYISNGGVEVSVLDPKNKYLCVVGELVANLCLGYANALGVDLVKTGF